MIAELALAAVVATSTPSASHLDIAAEAVAEAEKCWARLDECDEKAKACRRGVDECGTAEPKTDWTATVIIGGVSFAVGVVVGGWITVRAFDALAP